MAFNNSKENNFGFKTVTTKKITKKNTSANKSIKRDIIKRDIIKRDIISYKEGKKFKEFLLNKVSSGRIGVVPWYSTSSMVNNTNTVTNMVVLSISNLLYLSDFGGGLKKVTQSPYEGLKMELDDEVGKDWTQYLLKCIRQKPTLIFITTHLHSRIPFNILLFVRIDKNELDRLHFEPTKEVLDLNYLTMDQFHYIVDNKSSATSNGLRMYKEFREYISRSPELLNQVNDYFEYDTMHTPNHVNINKIELLENITFNNNPNIAYKKRREEIRKNKTRKNKTKNNKK